MPNPMPRVRREVLIALESIVGGECYNAGIQNYGPGGVREADGRSFRYPVVLRSADGTKTKIRDARVPISVTDEMLRSGCYQFGANQLDIMSALERVLQYLEKRHGLVLRAEGPAASSARQASNK